MITGRNEKPITAEELDSILGDTNQEWKNLKLRQLLMQIINHIHRNEKREPTAKEKYEEYRNNMKPKEFGYNSFQVGQLACLADAAIKEAEEGK